MNKKISRIMGVGLSLMLLASLMVFATPALAGTLSWSAEKNPTHTDFENLVKAGINIIDVAANGNTIFAATTNVSSIPLYKSTDGGATWKGLENSTSFPTGVSVKAVAIASDDANVVAFVTDAEKVEYSSNGGSSWTDLGTPAANFIISAIDIAPGTTRYIAVGGATATPAAELYTIKLAMAETWTARYIGKAGIAADQVDIKAVKYSPNYATDKAIAVVSGNGTTVPVFQLFRFESGDYDWNGAIDYLDVADWGTGLALTPAPAIAGGLAAADIALPSTFLANDEGERLAYVAVAGVTSGGGVIRLTDTVQKNFQTWSGATPGAIGSIAYHEAGKLVAGSWPDNRVFQFLDPNATTPKATRVNTLKQPGGTGMTTVVYSGDTVVAGTRGDESAIALSTDDGYSFNDVGLIDTTLAVMDDFAVNADGSKLYLATHSGDDTSLWLKAGSAWWKRVLSLKDQANPALLVRIAPDDDKAVYIGQLATQNMWVSKNSGETSWKSVPIYALGTGDTILDFAVASADVVYAVDNDGVTKTSNAGASWGSQKKPTDGVSPYMITVASNGDVLVGDTLGLVAFSKDGGATFSLTKDFGAGNAIVVPDDGYASNNIIYVGIGTAVKRGKADTTTSPLTRGATDLTIRGMAQSGTATYALTANLTQNSVLYQSLKLETAADTDDAEWSDVSAAGETYLAVPQALKVSVSKGTPKLWAIDTTSPDLESFTDAVSLVAPTVSSPADKAAVSINTASGDAYDVTFIFKRYASTSITRARLQIAVDSDFSGIVFNEILGDAAPAGDPAFPVEHTIARVIGPSGTAGGAVNYLPGSTYYWRVRTTAPLWSPWSATRSFTVETLVGPFATSGPALGASDVRLRPTLTWTAYPGAISYELQISEEADFSILTTGSAPLNTFYQVDEDLAYATTYYWRVRGVTGRPATAKATAPGGPWVTGIFTTMAKPVAPTPAVIVEKEPAPAPEVQIVRVPETTVVPQPIPAYLLWTIIIIGAILIIALIVLIVRTRRVA